jgi:hypothetical protein
VALGAANPQPANDSTHLLAAQPQLACRSYCGVSSVSPHGTPRAAVVLMARVEDLRDSQGDRKIGSRASPDFGFRAAARESNARALPRKYFWLWSSKDKNAFFLARLPTM